MQNSPARPDAYALVRGGELAPQLRGEVNFYQKPGYVLVEARISGLPDYSDTGFFAFHIHEGGSCTGKDFADTGGHYNPGGYPHPRHAGDLPPLLLCRGGAYMTLHTDRFRVRDIIGRTVVIHAHADDFMTQPSGNAGTKMACGVIKAK